MSMRRTIKECTSIQKWTPDDDWLRKELRTLVKYQLKIHTDVGFIETLNLVTEETQELEQLLKAYTYK